VDFFGFRALVYGLIPIDPSLPPLVGLNDQGFYKINNNSANLKDPLAK